MVIFLTTRCPLNTHTEGPWVLSRQKIDNHMPWSSSIKEGDQASVRIFSGIIKYRAILIIACHWHSFGGSILQESKILVNLGRTSSTNVTLTPECYKPPCVTWRVPEMMKKIFFRHAVRSSEEEAEQKPRWWWRHSRRLKSDFTGLEAIEFANFEMANQNQNQ